MKNKAAFLLILATIFIFPNCNNRNKTWTEQQRKDFETNCSQTVNFNNLTILFNGFENKEFDSVLVKEYNNTTVLDSFKVYVSPSQSPIDKENKERSATIQRTMNVNYRYLFIIPGQKPFELANMKMVMWAQFTMNSENWGCVMGDYTIDGVKFEHSANPTFVKQNID